MYRLRAVYWIHRHRAVYWICRHRAVYWICRPERDIGSPAQAGMLDILPKAGCWICHPGRDVKSTASGGMLDLPSRAGCWIYRPRRHIDPPPQACAPWAVTVLSWDVPGWWHCLYPLAKDMYIYVNVHEYVCICISYEYMYIWGRGGTLMIYRLRAVTHCVTIWGWSTIIHNIYHWVNHLYNCGNYRVIFITLESCTYTGHSHACVWMSWSCMDVWYIYIHIRWCMNTYVYVCVAIYMSMIGVHVEHTYTLLYYTSC
jgi:hypothetical protein